MNLNYGYDVLIPIACHFREDKNKANARFKLTSRGDKHRVEFIDR